MDTGRRPRSGSDEARHAAELLELGDAFFEMDRDWRIVRVNGRQELLSRRPRWETVGRTFAEIWPELATPQSRYWREYDRCMRERVPVAFQEYYAPFDMWTGVTAYPVSGGGVAVFLRDITVQKRAELEAGQRAAELEAILGEVAEGVLVYDADGRILRSNKAADRILGLGEDERRMPARERFASASIAWLREDGSELPEEELPVLRAARRGETFHGVVLGMRRPDRLQWVSISASPLVLGDAGVGAVASISDITERRRAEDLLRESERRLQRLIDVNPVGVVQRGFDGRVRYANDAYLRIVRRRREELESGQIRWDSLTAPEHLERERAAMAQAAAEGASPVFEKEYVLEHGERVPVLMACASMGIPGEVTAFVVDLSDRKRAEETLRESEQRFRMLAEAMPQIVCVLAPDGRVEYVNPNWLAYSGLDLEGSRRAGWEGVLHPSDLAAADECRRRALRSEDPQDVELRYRAADGTFRWFLSRLAPVREGGRVVRLVGSAVDVEERRRVTEALQRANDALRDADRRKDDFLGMLSHELRNPLAPIKNSLYILARAEPAGDLARRATDVIGRQVAHLTRLVDDLLDVTRIARGKVELRLGDVDLAALARRAADDYRPLMASRGIDLTVEVPGGPVRVTGDEVRLAQALGNLLSNAAKFTPAGGRVTLSLEAQERRAILRVRDTGPGIPAEVLPMIFEPFTQAKQTLARSEGGLGLGLALVKGLVTLHGGEIAAASPGAGQGTEFIVSLPAAGALAGRAREQPAGTEPGVAPHRRVLVVDDNRDAAESLAQLVTMLGHDAEIAYDAYQGLSSAAERVPDVVLCDIGLPGMDGYEFARQFRARAGGHGVRLVAVSGYAQPEDVTRAAEAGFDAHVAKPPDPERLAALLA
jgi:PAS domain S-box-containing protein